MISSVSFKGIYNIKNHSDNTFYSSVDNVYDEASKTKGFEDVKFDDSSFIFKVDDDYDSKLESFMNSKGIKFSKIDKKTLLTEQGIKSRIVIPEYRRQNSNYRIVEIDTGKFNEAYKKYGFQYIGDSDHIIQPERTKRFGEYLLTGCEIDASEVYIIDCGSYPEVDFLDGRHRYAYYRDMGMKAIPVVMDQESIKAARKFGLLAK